MTLNSDILKGSEKDRTIWKQWAYQNGLTDENGNFLNEAIDERRANFRLGLEERNVNLLTTIEHLLINMFHFCNAMTERWPETVRIMLNRFHTDEQDVKTPFDSWYGPPGLEKRKQATRV